MKLKVAEQETEYTPHPAGTFNAVCIWAIDLGLQEVTWQGEKVQRHQVLLRFESDQLMDTGKHFTINARLTASLHSKAILRHLLEGWKGEKLKAGDEIDLEKLAGAYVKLTVVQQYSQQGHAYAKVAALGKPDTHFPYQGDIITNENYLEAGDYWSGLVQKGMATYKQEQDAKVGKVEELDDEVPWA